jgi:hypothetical protein
MRRIELVAVTVLVVVADRTGSHAGTATRAA